MLSVVRTCVIEMPPLLTLEECVNMHLIHHTRPDLILKDTLIRVIHGDHVVLITVHWTYSKVIKLHAQAVEEYVQSMMTLSHKKLKSI